MLHRCVWVGGRTAVRPACVAQWLAALCSIPLVTACTGACAPLAHVPVPPPCPALPRPAEAAGGAAQGHALRRGCVHRSGGEPHIHFLPGLTNRVCLPSCPPLPLMPSTCPKADEQRLVRRACLARRPLRPPGITAHAWLARCRVKRRCCVMRMPAHWLNAHLCRCLFAGAGGAGRCRAARAVRNAGGGAARGGGPRRLFRYGAAMYWARIGPPCHLHLSLLLHLPRCAAVLLGACRSSACGGATGAGECRSGVLGRVRSVLGLLQAGC